MSDVQLRPARLGEEDALSELCLKSKAHWGYDEVFMAEVAPYLKVTRDAIEAGLTTVAELDDGTPLGVCQIDPGGHHGTVAAAFVALSVHRVRHKPPTRLQTGC